MVRSIGATYHRRDFLLFICKDSVIELLTTTTIISILSSEYCGRLVPNSVDDMLSFQRCPVLNMLFNYKDGLGRFLQSSLVSCVCVRSGMNFSSRVSKERPDLLREGI